VDAARERGQIQAVAKRPNPTEDEKADAPSDAASDDAPGATAYVRLDGAGKLPPRRPAPEATSGAPKKGLQVQLPDDEPPPPPKPKPAPPAEAPKGRRGAWWDQKSARADEAPDPAEEAAPEEPADDAPPPPRRKPPVQREQPARAPARAPPADDGRTQFFKPDQVVLAAEVRQRPAPAPVEPGLPWKQILLALAIALVVTMLSVVIVYRREIFDRSGGRPSRPAASATEKADE
jgi:hypothetical protein